VALGSTAFFESVVLGVEVKIMTNVWATVCLGRYLFRMGAQEIFGVIFSGVSTPRWSPRLGHHCSRDEYDSSVFTQAVFVQTLFAQWRKSYDRFLQEREVSLL
jgi:hypothetical protein